MTPKWLGYRWLMETYQLPNRPLNASSRLGTQRREFRSAYGGFEREYPPQYAPEATLAGHLEFALKYEGVELTVLHDLFQCCGPEPIAEAVRDRPTSRYRRQMGFFYEWLTQEELEGELAIGGNYIEALPDQHYWTSPQPTRNRRWRVWDNLLGTPAYCPVVRRTEALEAALHEPLQAELEGLVAEYPAWLFERANNYLYLKETRSTYAIEHEDAPQAARAERFVRLLREAGQGELRERLSEAALAEMQRTIVDPRYADEGFRQSQNYVGELRPDFTSRIHYIGPPPAWVPNMMAGLATTAERSTGLPAILRAAVVSFGFDFIHPFEDGNGRIHRFLIHDLLHRDGFVAPGIMLPVSATMLRQMEAYDAALEAYSRPLTEGMAEYTLARDGQLTLDNPEFVEPYFRYPDLTPQAEYLAATVARTVREDMVEELTFLQSYNTAREAIRDVVDMPDRRLDLLIHLLHQNHGRLSRNKRGQFAELSDQEIEKIETAFGKAFGG